MTMRGDSAELAVQTADSVRSFFSRWHFGANAGTSHLQRSCADELPSASVSLWVPMLVRAQHRSTLTLRKGPVRQ